MKLSNDFLLIRLLLQNAIDGNGKSRTGIQNGDSVVTVGLLKNDRYTYRTIHRVNNEIKINDTIQ